MFRIERDRARFREIVRGRLRTDLRKFLSSSELLGRRGEETVSVPVTQIETPRFKYGSNSDDGIGQGPGVEGDELRGEEASGDSSGAAGEEEGQHLLEVDVELAELADMLGEELELPNIESRGDRMLNSNGGSYSGIRSVGPKSLRHFRRTYKQALKRTVASGDWDPSEPSVVPTREDERIRCIREQPKPESSAVVFHIMDVSGSMGREQKEIVRIKAFWIDTWLRKQYDNLEVIYIVHDAVAKIVDQETFFHLRESGGTKISAAYDTCLSEILERYRPEDWNIYPFHYSDGDNWSARDTERCIAVLRDEILPRVNQFCYGQVKSAYGSGQFKKDLDAALCDEEGLVTCAVDDREGIPEAIRAFLGKGR